MNTLEQIKMSPVYKQILADSFGGVMYNVANRNKYDTIELVKLWNDTPLTLRESADGIIKGAMHFIAEEN